VNRNATLSDDGRYRYRLTRDWDASESRVAFCMLNPSTADAEEDDPTIRRCIGFAQSWGYGGLVVVNLFAYRATNPLALAAVEDPVGPENDAHLSWVAGSADLIVAAWGVGGGLRGRDRAVKARWATRIVHHLGLTKAGHPRHPLYLPSATRPERWQL
jgi:hypothetical protein